jgi:hypothetical protein
MRSRYLTNIALVVLGGFLVVASQAFAPATLTWLMLGVGVAALAIAGPALGFARRGLAQRGLDGAVAVIAAWTIVAGLVFSGAAVTWLGFASAAAIVAIAISALTLHELSTERVVHSLEVHGAGEAQERDFAHGATA